MRRTFYVVACVVAVVAMLASALPALAQAPAPKVTITGLIDNVVNWNRNQNMTHGGFDITKTDLDGSEAYARTRGRFDFIGEVGKSKGVLGFEFDLLYGATLRGTDNPSGRPDGTSGGFDADNDVRNALELRWMYVEAPLTGPGALMPFIPVAGMVRLGGQPFTITYKPQIFAASDFGGAHVDLVFAPNVKGSLTLVQHEEKLTGTRNGFLDEDIGVIFTVEVSPFKGLDIKPIYSYQEIGGDASANVRRGTGGIPDDTTVFPSGTLESRHTIGFDGRWRQGPWSLSPTFFYQFGERDAVDGVGARRQADISAWILDVEAGYRIGPLLLEGRGVVTSGNKAKDNLFTDDIEYYQPFQTGNAYWFGWGEAVGIGAIDYLTSLNSFSNSLSLPAQPSYDRYGRIMFAARGTYSITPALSAYGIVTPMWTLEKVDTDGTATSAAGITPAADAKGDARFLGTGLTAGLTYRFAPGVTFDTVYGVLFSDDAFGLEGRDPKDSYVASARLRFTF